MAEGEEDESPSDDRNNGNIPVLDVGMSCVLASRVPIMSAHDGRLPIDENFPFEPRHRRVTLMCTASCFLQTWSLPSRCPAAPPYCCRGPPRLWMGRLHYPLEEVE